MGRILFVTIINGLIHRLLKCQLRPEHEYFIHSVSVLCQFCNNNGKLVNWKRGSLAVSALIFSARGHGFDARGRRGPNMLSLVSFAGMTLNKSAVLRIGTLTGAPPPPCAGKGAPFAGQRTLQ